MWKEAAMPQLRYCAGKYLKELRKITTFQVNTQDTFRMQWEALLLQLTSRHASLAKTTEEYSFTALPNTNIKMGDSTTVFLNQMSRISHLTVFQVRQLVKAMCWICFGSAVVSCWGMQRSWVVYLCWVVFSALLRWKVGGSTLWTGPTMCSQLWLLSGKK